MDSLEERPEIFRPSARRGTTSNIFTPQPQIPRRSAQHRDGFTPAQQKNIRDAFEALARASPSPQAFQYSHHYNPGLSQYIASPKPKPSLAKRRSSKPNPVLSAVCKAGWEVDLSKKEEEQNPDEKRNHISHTGASPPIKGNVPSLNQNESTNQPHSAPCALIENNDQNASPNLIQKENAFPAEPIQNRSENRLLDQLKQDEKDVSGGSEAMGEIQKLVDWFDLPDSIPAKPSPAQSRSIHTENQKKKDQPNLGLQVSSEASRKKVSGKSEKIVSNQREKEASEKLRADAESPEPRDKTPINYIVSEKGPQILTLEPPVIHENLGGSKAEKNPHPTLSRKRASLLSCEKEDNAQVEMNSFNLDQQENSGQIRDSDPIFQAEQASPSLSQKNVLNSQNEDGNSPPDGEIQINRTNSDVPKILKAPKILHKAPETVVENPGVIEDLEDRGQESAEKPKSAEKGLKKKENPRLALVRKQSNLSHTTSDEPSSHYGASDPSFEVNMSEMNHKSESGWSFLVSESSVDPSIPNHSIQNESSEEEPKEQDTNAEYIPSQEEDSLTDSDQEAERLPSRDPRTRPSVDIGAEIQDKSHAQIASKFLLNPLTKAVWTLDPQRNFAASIPSSYLDTQSPSISQEKEIEREISNPEIPSQSDDRVKIPQQDSVPENPRSDPELENGFMRTEGSDLGQNGHGIQQEDTQKSTQDLQNKLTEEEEDLQRGNRLEDRAEENHVAQALLNLRRSSSQSSEKSDQHWSSRAIEDLGLSAQQNPQSTEAESLREEVLGQKGGLGQNQNQCVNEEHQKGDGKKFERLVSIEKVPFSPLNQTITFEKGVPPIPEPVSSPRTKERKPKIPKRIRPQSPAMKVSTEKSTGRKRRNSSKISNKEAKKPEELKRRGRPRKLDKPAATEKIEHKERPQQNEEKAQGIPDLEVKVSKTGRVRLPPLAYWAGQSIKYEKKSGKASLQNPFADQLQFTSQSQMSKRTQNGPSSSQGNASRKSEPKKPNKRVQALQNEHSVIVLDSSSQESDASEPKRKRQKVGATALSKRTGLGDSTKLSNASAKRTQKIETSESFDGFAHAKKDIPETRNKRSRNQVIESENEEEENAGTKLESDAKMHAAKAEQEKPIANVKKSRKLSESKKLSQEDKFQEDSEDLPCCEPLEIEKGVFYKGDKKGLYPRCSECKRLRKSKAYCGTETSVLSCLYRKLLGLTYKDAVTKEMQDSNPRQAKKISDKIRSLQKKALQNEEAEVEPPKKRQKATFEQQPRSKPEKPSPKQMPVKERQCKLDLQEDLDGTNSEKEEHRDGWSYEQISALQSAVCGNIDPSAPNYWKQIAKCVPGKKSGVQCYNQYMTQFGETPAPKPPKAKRRSSEALLKGGLLGMPGKGKVSKAKAKKLAREQRWQKQAEHTENADEVKAQRQRTDRYIDAWKRGSTNDKTSNSEKDRAHQLSKTQFVSQRGLIDEIAGLVAQSHRHASQLESDDEEEKDDYFSDASDDLL